MAKFFRLVGAVLGVLVVLVAGLLTYVSLALPKVAPADESVRVEVTPQRVKRGAYLANHVAACMGCHSQRDWNTYGHPIKPGTLGMGGEPIFDERIGLPGRLHPKNITPYGLKDTSDGELVRVLRTGVRKNGEPLFPFMPYQAFAQMSQEDLYSIIAYLRTLPPIANDVDEHKLIFPVNFIVRSIPKDAPAYPAAPDPKDSVAYGKYLVNMGSCAACHTPVDAHHQPIPGKDFAGGQIFPCLNSRWLCHPGGGVLRVPNITPDKDTGIGNWSKQDFIARFAGWRGEAGKAQMHKLDLDKGDYLELMPYREYSGMTDQDLGAIYDYLRTVPPVNNAVVRFEPPKL